MKKGYTVKQVVKMGERVQSLLDVEYGSDGELFSFPLALLTAIGMIMAAGYFKEQCQSVVPLIAGASSTLLGVNGFAQIFTAGSQIDKLRDRINGIYDEMGPEFENEVKAIVRSR